MPYILRHPIESPDQAKHHQSADDTHERDTLPCGRIACFVRTIAFLPIDAILVDAPIADACHTSVGYRRAASYYLTPATIPLTMRASFLR